MNKRIALLAIALLATLAFSTAIDAPVPRSLAFDSAHARIAVEGLTPAGVSAAGAGSVLLGDSPFAGRHGFGSCIGATTRGSTLTVSYDTLCGVCGDGRLAYSWTSVPSKEFQVQERLLISCRTDLLVVAADPAFERAAGEQGEFRVALKNYFDGLGSDGITARWVPLSSAKSQAAMSFSPGNAASGLRRVVRVSQPAIVLLVGDFPADAQTAAQASSQKTLFARLPLSVDASAAFFSRAAAARSQGPSFAKPAVVEYCGGDAACKAKARALAGLSRSPCPSASCLSSLPPESLSSFASQLASGSKLFLVTPPESAAGADYSNAVLFVDVPLAASTALESGALAVIAPTGMSFDWWKKGEGDTVESAGFSGAEVAFAYSAGGKAPGESVQAARKAGGLFNNPAGNVRIGNAMLAQEQGGLLRSLAGQIAYYGDPTIGLDAAAVAKMRGN